MTGEEQVVPWLDLPCCKEDQIQVMYLTFNSSNNPPNRMKTILKLPRLIYQQ
jgi:hypothetical protein